MNDPELWLFNFVSPQYMTACEGNTSSKFQSYIKICSSDKEDFMSEHSKT